MLRSKQKEITMRELSNMFERVWRLRTLGHQTSCMFAIHTPTRTGNFYILKRTFSSVLTNILNGWLVRKRVWLLPERLCILNAFLSLFVINERMTTACLRLEGFLLYERIQFFYKQFLWRNRFLVSSIDAFWFVSVRPSTRHPTITDKGGIKHECAREKKNTRYCSAETTHRKQNQETSGVIHHY